ncbi:hypothetical protein SAMN02745857_00907 [Andreprevotia lacus DSM 23236]|jgi:hypothetical protein|uniref:DUF6817 domain-containing protein n=1 Tax=Andreprevotia lacus DSM 23236 TaxID=1121001 RepID=A0A1W1X915_9NEIS|nr:hypothetical protein [Andreprevotia lacus]SMC20314.1 hypothetical protein SAMN02745857_00907 [Andreprevotia lacus DSM 23236]
MSLNQAHHASQFAALQALGAGEFIHLNGSLAEHLHGTASLLHAWGADTTLVQAGLFHAAYGTAGYGEALAPLSLRNAIADLIGTGAEALVYLYCACNRALYYPRLGTPAQSRLPDRFSDSERRLSDWQIAALCELTAANETEIALHSKTFLQQYGSELHALFQHMAPWLSATARAETSRVFAPHAAAVPA